MELQKKRNWELRDKLESCTREKELLLEENKVIKARLVEEAKVRAGFHVTK